jgi:hypothetical protein
MSSCSSTVSARRLGCKQSRIRYTINYIFTMGATKISQTKKLNLENEEPILTKWLQEFKSYNTKRAYRTALRKYKQILDIDNLENYLKDNPDTEADIRTFLQAMDGKPSKTVSCYTQIVKVFFQDHGVKVPDEAWKKIRYSSFNCLVLSVSVLLFANIF